MVIGIPVVVFCCRKKKITKKERDLKLDFDDL
jgi:hypothetical protein